MQLQQEPVRSPVKIIEQSVTCLATTVYVNAACAVQGIIFGTGKLVSNFTELCTLTLAAHSYALLVWLIASKANKEKIYSVRK